MVVSFVSIGRWIFSVSLSGSLFALAVVGPSVASLSAVRPLSVRLCCHCPSSSRDLSGLASSLEGSRPIQRNRRTAVDDYKK